MRRVFLISILSLLWSELVAGQLLSENVHSDVLGENKTVLVYLPTGVSVIDTTRYPVVYFLHGSGFTPAAYLPLADTLEVLIARGAKPMILAFPQGGEVPLFANSTAYGAYATHVLDEVIPAIERIYPAIGGKNGRALMGHSTGGHGAARIALQNPEMFSAFAAHAGLVSLHKYMEGLAEIVLSEAGLRDMPIPSMGPACTFMYKISRIYSPNPSAEYGCDPIVGAHGIIQEDVWDRWKVNDPYSIIEEEGDAFGLGIYLDAGNADVWRSVTTHLADLLATLEIDHQYEIFIGDHTTLEGQYPKSLGFLADQFETALSRFEIIPRQLPENPILLTTWPNPFNGTASVTIQLAQPGIVSLGLYDLLGRRVLTLHEGHVPAGSRQFSLEADGLSSGCYFLRAESVGGASQTRRLVLVR